MKKQREGGPVDAGNADARKLLLERFANPWGRTFLVVLALWTAGFATLFYHYRKYARIVDESLRAGAFGTASMLYAAPRPITLGEDVSAQDIAAYLRRCGYSDSERNRLGSYRASAGEIEIDPGPEAYERQAAVITVQGGHVVRIESRPDHARRAQYLLEPEPITNLFGESREKRVIVHFGRIPKVMVNAILSAEDKHFFHHEGFDVPRILRALWIDLKDRRNSQGASTLTQQLARTLWLGHERGWRRKIPETLITIHLENTLTKPQIFEDYANAIYLGNQGSFSIHGFAKASRTYFGKDLDQVTLPEAALLAGLIQAPQARNPFRHAERARARRDTILKAMRANGFITKPEYDAAIASRVVVTHAEVEASDAPYFVDLVNDTLQNRFPDRDFQNHPFRVYTTLDMDLQRDAVAAMRSGIAETDRQWMRRTKKYGTPEMPRAQAALVVLDAQTGEVKALVGGRNYGQSQLDRAEALRQPGSSFKPFVYAAALNSALSEGSAGLTPASTVDDEPTSFDFDGKTYQPGSYEESYAGTVTLRYALAHSLNIPAVKVAEMAGYGQVARVARAAGLSGVQPTPSIALGSYDVTPLEIAGAYTVFANSGVFVKPTFIQAILGQDSGAIFESHPVRKAALDARVAYLVENMMEEVLRSGTGAGVRSRGFYLPAAGKTGTSHDGWFAGFTSRLICVAWVGFDDDRDLKLSGANSALPVWTEFMKRAHQHPEYRNVHAFAAPGGIVTAQIDSETGELARPDCPKVRTEVFIEGTQPVRLCHLHGAKTQASGAGAP